VGAPMQQADAREKEEREKEAENKIYRTRNFDVNEDFRYRFVFCLCTEQDFCRF
jgi:hypothetical protein